MKMLNGIMKTVALGVIICGSQGVAGAQSAQTGNPPAQDSQCQCQSHDRPSPEQRMEQMLQELTQRVSLNPQQVQQVRVILTNAHTQMEALHSQGGERPNSQSHGQRQAIHFQVEDQIWAILTSPQKETFRIFWREHHAQRMNHMREHRRHHHENR